MSAIMNRLVFVGLLLSMLVITGAYAFAGHAEIGTARHAHISPETCRYARYDGHHGWSRIEVTKTIRCAVHRWPVPGGASTAVAVARCESGLFYRAVSGSGTYRGVFQQSVNYWAGRYRAFSPDRFDLKPEIMNGRTNVVVSIVMVHRAGSWSDWSCA